MKPVIDQRTESSARITVSNGFTYDRQGIRHRQRTRKTLQRPQGMSALQWEKYIEDQAALLFADVKRGSAAVGRQYTFAEAAEVYLNEHLESKKASPKTVDGYRDLLNMHIMPAIGHARLQEISARQLTQFYNKLARAGKTATTNACHRFIRAVFNLAIKWEMGTTKNPASGATVPPHTPSPRNILDPDQCSIMVRALDKEPIKYRAAVLLALFAQLRKGELMGLNWENINFDQQTVTVEQSMTPIKLPEPDAQGRTTKTIRKPPKTPSSRRVVSIPKPMVDMLHALELEQAQDHLALGESYNGEDAVFAHEDGVRMGYAALNHWFPEFLQRAGLPHIRLHDLRGTAASIKLNVLKVPPKTVQYDMRHKNMSTTHNFYDHVIGSVERDASDRFGELVFRK